ncbi:MAG: hypothetical protein DMG41_01185 [Acidobacteria bacterium]|nr:MAG: hypothetical protein AUH13_19890 [Acidobacteria bacterium 13_2_20CM_58_27]PYT75391.1 MAG: hypothetical protein DMG42_08755 [Acidobacteriota bacterium]PYT91861.1 MAG: hypothetical protein DMG41_01185 [Acidobacteriota bacterium]
MPERFAFRELHPTIRKEPVAMKQLPAQNHFSKRAQSMVFRKMGCDLPHARKLVIATAAYENLSEPADNKLLFAS